VVPAACRRPPRVMRLLGWCCRGKWSLMVRGAACSPSPGGGCVPG
ncbi:TXNDC15 isoform 2, partial [Pan troglodytes]